LRAKQGSPPSKANAIAQQLPIIAILLSMILIAAFVTVVVVMIVAVVVAMTIIVTVVVVVVVVVVVIVVVVVVVVVVIVVVVVFSVVIVFVVVVMVVMVGVVAVIVFVSMVTHVVAMVVAHAIMAATHVVTAVTTVLRRHARRGRRGRVARRAHALAEAEGHEALAGSNPFLQLFDPETTLFHKHEGPPFEGIGEKTVKRQTGTIPIAEPSRLKNLHLRRTALRPRRERSTPSPTGRGAESSWASGLIMSTTCRGYWPGICCVS
jgi:hypothetical protein